jgi:hypothetical protein
MSLPERANYSLTESALFPFPAEPAQLKPFVNRFPVVCQFPAYSAESIVKLPQTARKYRKQAAYEAAEVYPVVTRRASTRFVKRPTQLTLRGCFHPTHFDGQTPIRGRGCSMSG